MKFLIRFIFIFLLTSNGFSQDQYSKMAFIQSREANTTMFEKDGYRSIDYEGKEATEDVFKRTLNDDSYELVYSNYDHLESITIYSSFDDVFYDFLSDCKKLYEEIPSDELDVAGVFESDSFRYEFIEGYDFVGLMYIIKITKL